MHVMELQLEEMKTEHLLKNQPILVLNQPVFRIETPKFFYFPPQNRFSFQARYFFDATLVNASDDPGITVCVLARIIIPKKEKPIAIRTFTERFSISSSKDRPNKVHFLFVGDFNGELFDALREKETIKIETEIYYKNTLGACFFSKNTYRFNTMSFDTWSRNDFDKNNKDKLSDPWNTIREWHTAIVQAPIKYKENLNRLKDIVRDKKQRKEYESAFEEVRMDFISMYTEKKIWYADCMRIMMLLS